jgi:cadmium resistance protein CadD (predicted permease)
MVVVFATLFEIGVSAFVATNIDDIFVLIVFFSSKHFRIRNVVIGQYLGIGMLIIISALGSLLALIVPPIIIALLGIMPISIGIIRLLQLRKHMKTSETDQKVHVNKWHEHLSMLTVAAVTFSNGGDNIGIYTPLFAKYNIPGEIIIVIGTFMVMTAIWCVIAYYLVNHPLVAGRVGELKA